MPLILCAATTTDAPRIAEIHMAAFAQNVMLLAQFPTPAVRKGLQAAIEAKARADILDPRISVLVVKDVDKRNVNSTGGNGHIISFANWIHPVATGEDYTETPWVWPEGTVLEVVDAWTRKVGEAAEKVLGKRSCFRLSFMGTDPLHQKRGAATMLIQWGIDHCKQENVPAYLESTLEALPLYEKMGFRVAAEISLRFEERGDGTASLYEEAACIFQPGIESL